jgi:hypothetical protein
LFFWPQNYFISFIHRLYTYLKIKLLVLLILYFEIRKFTLNFQAIEKKYINYRSRWKSVRKDKIHLKKFEQLNNFRPNRIAFSAHFVFTAKNILKRLFVKSVRNTKNLIDLQIWSKKSAKITLKLYSRFKNKDRSNKISVFISK